MGMKEFYIEIKKERERESYKPITAPVKERDIIKDILSECVRINGQMLPLPRH
jgi:hypothetical protein